MKAVKNHYYPQQATPYNTPQHPCLSSTTLECHSASSQQCGPGMPSLLASHSSAALECHRSRHLTAVRPWNAIAPSISQQCGLEMLSLPASHSSAALECHSLHPHSSEALECHLSQHHFNSMTQEFTSIYTTAQ